MITFLLAAVLQVAANAADIGALPFVRPLQVGDTVPDAAFVDQLGRRRTWRDYRGHTTVVSFIYTRCPDTRICPLISAKFAFLQKTLPPSTRLIEFTLDSAYDVPSVMKRYGEMFGANPERWTLATGDGETMREIAVAFGIGISARAASTVAHSQSLAIVNSAGVVLNLVDGDSWQPQEVEAAVRDSEGFRSNPWERLALGVRGVARQCGLVGAKIGHDAELLVVWLAIAHVIGAVFLIDVLMRRFARPKER